MLQAFTDGHGHLQVKMGGTIDDIIADAADIVAEAARILATEHSSPTGQRSGEAVRSSAYYLAISRISYAAQVRLGLVEERIYNAPSRG